MKAMRTLLLIGTASLAALSGCGLENLFGNLGHQSLPRPASAIRGSAPWAGAQASQITATDGDLNALEPFLTTVEGGAYDLRLPSSKYSMAIVHGRAGDMELRAIVPFVGEESTVTGVDLDARNMTETLIVEAYLSAKDMPFRKLTPGAYVGDGVTSGTRTLIRKAFDQPGPTQDLLRMVERLMAVSDPAASVPDPFLFLRPELDVSFNVTTSPLQSGWLLRIVVDYDGDGSGDTDSIKFDAKLAQVAQLYRPEGCPDPTRLRLMFTVDFNDGALNGNCGNVNRFAWLSPKTIQADHRMFFVGWIYTRTAIPISEVNDPAINNLLGASVPNTIPMYDDGTNGDEVDGDGIWTVYFDVPYDPTKVLRIGYKYTWGTPGHIWTGTEEWPGNSRILELVDVNGDGFVYRRDVFGDEATNKDNLNLNTSGTGSITWTTDLHGCGPESHEQMFTLHSACQCGTAWWTPQSVGPITVACTGP